MNKNLNSKELFKQFESIQGVLIGSKPGISDEKLILDSLACLAGIYNCSVKELQGIIFN